MENIDKEFIMAHCRDRRQGYPFVFEKNYGLDMKVPNHPEYFVKAPHNQTVKVEITTCIFSRHSSMRLEINYKEKI